MIKVHIKRKASKENREALLVLIKKLRSVTMGAPGYIAGETLKRMDKPEEVLVVTKWQSAYYWDEWFQGAQRAEIQGQIDALLGGETTYEIYEYQ